MEELRKSRDAGSKKLRLCEKRVQVHNTHSTKWRPVVLLLTHLLISFFFRLKEVEQEKRALSENFDALKQQLDSTNQEKEKLENELRQSQREVCPRLTPLRFSLPVNMNVYMLRRRRRCARRRWRRKNRCRCSRRRRRRKWRDCADVARLLSVTSRSRGKRCELRKVLTKKVVTYSLLKMPLGKT